MVPTGLVCPRANRYTLPMHRFALPLSAALLAGCPTTDAIVDTVLAEGPYGALLELDPSTLPEGVDPSEVRLVEITEAFPDLGEAVEGGLSAALLLEPVGIELSAPATLTLPVGSWPDLGARNDPWSVPPDSVDPTTSVLGQAPALAMASLYQAQSQAMSNAAHNAAMAQQSMNQLSQAVTAASVARILGMPDPSSTSGRDTVEPIDALRRVVERSHTAWNAFASDPDGNALIQSQNVVPVDGSQSSLAASADAGSFNGPIEYGTFEWVETTPGTWDVKVQTRFFDSYQLVKVHIDEDGNGIHDVLEGVEDTDGDGIWNPEDWDNDGDRLADAVELDFDDDGDGLPAFNDPDRDDDGVLDGVADCDGQPCACGLRSGVDRVLCVEGDDVTCEDADLEGLVVEFEVVPTSCPDPLPTDGATCSTPAGELAPLQLHHYGVNTDPAAALFCLECDPTTLSPANYCDAFAGQQ